MAEPEDTTAPAGTWSRFRPDWFTPGVGGIGTASLLSDLGHEIPTALLPSFVTATLGAPAAALELIEGISDGLAGQGQRVRPLTRRPVCGSPTSR